MGAVATGQFDHWAQTYDRSQLQTVLYGPVHDAALRYVRQYVRDPGRILDVGCGTGRLSARLAAVYCRAHVVRVDASTGMIMNAAAVPVRHPGRFAAAAAEQLAFADAVFDLVVVTLSVSHWQDRARGFAEISRVMAPGAALMAAEVCPARPVVGWARHRKPALAGELLTLTAAGGLRVEHVEPIRSVALIANAVLVAAWKPVPAGAAGEGSVRPHARRHVLAIDERRRDHGAGR